MSVRIIVLSDGETWETVGDQQVLKISDEDYEKLVTGEYNVGDIEATVVANVTESGVTF
jgi:hypothetical protein